MGLGYRILRLSNTVLTHFNKIVLLLSVIVCVLIAKCCVLMGFLNVFATS